MSGPRGHSTPEDRARRRKLALIVALALVVLVGWFVVILALSGGEEQGGSSGSSGSGQEPKRTGQTSPDAPVSEGGETSGPQKPASSGEGSEPSSSSSSSSGGGPSEAELEDAADESLSPPPGGGAPEGEVPVEDTEGRSNGQRGFVASFVGAAYGYTGKDVEEYRSGYEGRIDTGTYYESGGGAVLEEYAAMVEDGGAENAAVLEEYRIISGEPVETEVDEAGLRQFAPRRVLDGPIPEGASISEVTYAVGDRYGDPSKDEDFGKVYGDVDYLKQRLFLSREEGGWKILAASAPESTEPPEQPDPDAPKVGEPGGPGEHEH